MAPDRTFIRTSAHLRCLSCCKISRIYHHDSQPAHLRPASACGLSAAGRPPCEEHRAPNTKAPRPHPPYLRAFNLSNPVLFSLRMVRIYMVESFCIYLFICSLVHFFPHQSNQLTYAIKKFIFFVLHHFFLSSLERSGGGDLKPFGSAWMRIVVHGMHQRLSSGLWVKCFRRGRGGRRKLNDVSGMAAAVLLL